MNQNSLIEIGSRADVILRFKTQTTINGKEYNINEPYLFLKDVSVLVNYSNQDKSGRTDINVIAHSDIKPRTVSIGGVSFTRKLASLLACYKESNVEYNPTFFRALVAERYPEDTEGVIYLTDSCKLNENLFIYDSNFDLVTDIRYDAVQGAIYSESFLDMEEYLISFSSVKSGTKFDMNKPAIPYMSLEIQGIGNIDKKTKNVMMYFDKVSLNSLLQFTFIQNDIINVPLEFYIIDDKNNYVVFEE